MSQKGYQCVKCGHSSTKGFLVDYSQGSDFVVRWVEGEPQNVTVFGITGKNVETRDRRQFNVRSLRCERCGFLELYAV